MQRWPDQDDRQIVDEFASFELRAHDIAMSKLNSDHFAISEPRAVEGACLDCKTLGVDVGDVPEVVLGD